MVPIQNVTVEALSGSTVVTTTPTNDLGEFLLRGLDPGTYTLRIVVDETTTVETDPIDVVIGEVADAGPISL